MQLNPYLHFNGECEEAFNFYSRCFGGQIEAMLPHAGTPVESYVPAEWKDKIMHARLVFGDQALMGCDSQPTHYQKPQGFSATLEVNDVAEAERIFRELAKDGAVQMPLQETFWAVRFGMLTDRFGIPWMVNCTKELSSSVPVQ